MRTGVPGSGKNTIMKQMKIVHQNGYTHDELVAFRLVVYQNLVDSAKYLVLALNNMGVEFVNGINKTYSAQILEYEVNSDPSFRLSPEIANAVDSVWKDPIVATVTNNSSEFYLPDSASYFFSHVQRIAQKDYLPSEKDALKAKTKSAGITETRFDMGQLTIRCVTLPPARASLKSCLVFLAAVRSVFDVGSQRSERKKWIHCFENVTAVIFCAALSSYDQVLLEDNKQNIMAESLILFESVINSRWFLRSSIILFLTKIDLFKAKLPKVPLENFFPEYVGGPDVNKAAKYMLWRFTQANRARLTIYPHLTDPNDTSNIRLVFAAIKETILQNALRDSGILRDTPIL
ncbi:Guanine nucleotide-binding protein alpha-2 subunit [Tulasnella sp. 417]|nr:Guanine nucleotide-binding protein alpha-2 subunit [Tulasnella sp. 417]